MGRWDLFVKMAAVPHKNPLSLVYFPAKLCYNNDERNAETMPPQNACFCSHHPPPGIICRRGGIKKEPEEEKCQDPRNLWTATPLRLM